MEHNGTSIIVATIVPEAARLDFLPRHFGPLMLAVERQIYSWLSTLSQDYSGALTGISNWATRDATSHRAIPFGFESRFITTISMAEVRKAASS
jgi:hypothetical protein